MPTLTPAARRSRLSLSALALTALSLVAAAPPLPVPPASQPPTPGQPRPPLLRLPEGVSPTRYVVDLRLDPRADAFTGHIDIGVRVEKETALLWVNGSDELRLETVRVRRGPEEFAARVAVQSGDFIGIALDRPLSPGVAELRIDYKGRLPMSEGGGLFREKDGEDFYLYSHFEPIEARRAFPCFDEPGFKVPWQLTLRVPDKQLAVSNTPAVSDTPEPGGGHRVVFKETPPLPSYLVALAVGPFGVVDAGRAGKNGTPVRILTLRGHEAQARYAARATAPIVKALEDYFGIPYPYEKLDQIALPSQNGAMENAGLITYGQRHIQIRPEEETPTARRGFSRICAHELAHQWTGNLVTLAYWDDLWLNESFASFFESKIIETLEPTWYEPLDRQLGRAGAMAADSLESARRIRQPIATSDDIVNAFDGITYAKGKAILFMIEEWLGADVFQRGVRRYLNQYAGRNATARDFIDMLVSTAQQKPVAGGSDARSLSGLIPGVMSSALDQTGVPVISLKLKCDGPAPVLLADQARYRPLGATEHAGDPPYRTPLCIRYGGATGADLHQCTVLDRTGRTEIPLSGACPDHVVASANGYYRIEYDAPLLARLTGPATAAAATAPAPRPLALTDVERIGLISDLGALVRSGQQPADGVLRAVTRIAADPSTVGEVLSATYGVVRSLGEIVPPERRGSYERLLQRTYGPRLRALGLRLRTGESEDARLLRARLIPVVIGEGGDPQLLAEAQRLVTAWLRDRRTLEAESAYPLVDAVAQRGDRALFDQLHAAARAETDRPHRMLLLSALGAFRDPALAQAGLALVLSGEFPLRDALRLLYRPLASPTTRELPFAYVQKNFDALVAGLPRDSGAGLAAVSAVLCDDAQRAEAQRFFEGRSTRYRGGPRALAQSLEKAQRCSSLARGQQASLSAFLATY